MGFETLQLPAGWVDVAGRTVGEYEDKLRKQIVRTGLKELTRIRICRLPTVILGGRYETNSPAGHYWVEIINDLTKMDGSEKFIESYGWYPVEPATFSKMFTTEGCLNSDSPYFRYLDIHSQTKIPTEAGRAVITEEDKIYSLYPFDPHHNKRYTLPDSEKGEVNHPYLFADDSRTEEDIIKEIRNFAESHISNKNEKAKKWSYQFERYSEYNCHTFLFNLLYETNIADRYILKDLHFIKFFDSALKYKSEIVYTPDYQGGGTEIKISEKEKEEATVVYNKMNQVLNNASKLAAILK